MPVTYAGLTVSWLGYATVRIEVGETVAYLDPGRYGVLDGYRAEDGDLVCVTHDHHYDSDGIDRVAAPDATILVYEGVDADRIDREVSPVSALPYDVRRVTDDADLAVDDVVVGTVPAYNEPDGPHTTPEGEPFHPEGFGCGFQLTVQRGDGPETTIFWPGDTDVLPGHEALTPTVFLPPIGGSFTMDRHEAAALAAEMAPELVLPVHYNTFEALETDERAFAADVAAAGIPVALDA